MRNPLAAPGLEGETKGTQTSSDKSQMSGKLEIEGFTKYSPDNNWLKVKNQTANWMGIQNKRKPQAAGWVERQITDRSLLEVRLLECKVCKETFGSKEDLIAHMKLRTRNRTAMVETVRKAVDWLEDLEAGNTQRLTTRG